jgi:hypothetical protein
MNFVPIVSILLTLLSFHAVSSLCVKQHSYTIRFEKHPFSPNRLEHFKSLAENSIILQVFTTLPYYIPHPYLPSTVTFKTKLTPLPEGRPHQ